MSSHFDGPDRSDDGALRTIRYRDVVDQDHPVRFIDQFVSSLDVSSFESRYKVGDSQTGRSPKDVRLMLSVILYAIYQRIYSARKIDYATEHHADFWFFTHGERISHDKISDFVNMHEDDIHTVFLATISLARQNKLMSFSALFQDGYLLKANAARHRSATMGHLRNAERKISDALDGVLAILQSPVVDEETIERKKELENKLAKIGKLRDKLQRKIAQRSTHVAPWKAREIAAHTTINQTDTDADVMRLKNGGKAPGYLKVSAVDEKAGIVVASTVSGYNDEPHLALPLFAAANRNCEGAGAYTTLVADANFTSAENCASCETAGIALIGPTRESEHQARHGNETPDAVRFDETADCFHCSQGHQLHETGRYFDRHKNTTIRVFSNEQACRNCAARPSCTKAAYRSVKQDIRFPAQNRVLQRYHSPQGRAIYKRRSHLAETPQGDLKQNGRFHQFLRRGLKKVTTDSLWLDITWNLRKIFNALEPSVVGA